MKELSTALCVLAAQSSRLAVEQDPAVFPLGMGGFTVYHAPNFHGTETAKVTVFYGTIY